MASAFEYVEVMLAIEARSEEMVGRWSGSRPAPTWLSRVRVAVMLARAR